jgi:hypothetical protein
MGVRLVNLAAGQSLVAVARNAEPLVGANGGPEGNGLDDNDPADEAPADGSGLGGSEDEAGQDNRAQDDSLGNGADSDRTMTESSGDNEARGD